MTSTVYDYRKEFIRSAANLHGVSEDIMIDCFIKGLFPDIQAEIDIAECHDLLSTMLKAQRVEHKKRLLTKSSLPPASRHSPIMSPSPAKMGSPNSYRGVNPWKSVESSPPQRTGTFVSPSKGPRPRKINLTVEQIQDRKARRLCFSCNDKYSPGHRCNKELHVLVLNDNLERPTDDEDDQDLIPMDETVEPVKLVEIQHQAVTVLIDCSASHNFISSDVVEALTLSISDSSKYGITLGNGHKVPRQGIFKYVPLTIQELRVVDHFLPLPMGNVDVILGMQWLTTMGKTVVEWNTLRMTFQRDGHNITLQGDPSLNRSGISFKAMHKEIQQENELCVALFQVYIQDPRSSQRVDGDLLSEFRNQFPAVFEAPTSLPPVRSIDHTICLEPGTKPVSTKPYHYPHAMKTEIEKLVGEMCAAGIIQPSLSHMPARRSS
ncbi:uncharacterized protein LOC144710546 [Wolffia australiana]